MIFSIPTGRTTPRSTDREIALEVTPNRNFHTTPDRAYGSRKTIIGLARPQPNGITARNIVLNRCPVPARTLRSPNRINPTTPADGSTNSRSEEHTSELQ